MWSLHADPRTAVTHTPPVNTARESGEGIININLIQSVGREREKEGEVGADLKRATAPRHPADAIQKISALERNIKSFY